MEITFLKNENEEERREKLNGLTVQISPFRGLRWMFIPEATMKHNTINAELTFGRDIL